MADLTLYIKPTCSTCRKAVALLDEQGVEYETVRYYDTPLTPAKLHELIEKAGGDVRPFVRSKGIAQHPEYGLGDPDKPVAEVVDALAAEPDLLQRPIAELPDRAIVARPVESLIAFLAPE